MLPLVCSRDTVSVRPQDHGHVPVHVHLQESHTVGFDPMGGGGEHTKRFNSNGERMGLHTIGFDPPRGTTSEDLILRESLYIGRSDSNSNASVKSNLGT